MSQGQFNFSDSSGPLFNMYVKMAEEEDNKMADRWQKDADGILIFVGFCYLLYCYAAAIDQHEHYRLVCFLPQSPHWLQCLSKTSDRIPRIPPHSISRTSISFSQTPTYLAHQSLPLQLNHLPSPHQNTQFVSTHSGS